jgi:hypothetical protein
MALTKLDDVIREASRSSKFLDDLLTNAKRSLSAKGWHLSARDMTRLRRLIKERKEVQILTKVTFRRISRSDNPWIPPSWMPSKRPHR